MSTQRLVLWAIDTELAPRDFERLCADLLQREGYGKVVPIGGTKDHGRDAEAIYWSAESSNRTRTAFQFSLQEDWERKLRADAAKIRANAPDVTSIVFVTSRTVTGEKQDKLAAEFQASLGCTLRIYSREWLRLRLEEAHTDLARRYLRIDLPDTVCSIASRLEDYVFDGKSGKELFRDKSPEMVRAGIVESTRLEPQVVANWKRLAQIDIYLEDFPNALAAAGRALELAPQDYAIRHLKAVVLAECGIESNSMPMLLQAREIFETVASKRRRPEDYFNLANVLSALGELEAAEKNYRLALEAKPDYAEAWKNLGTLYTKLGKHQPGMDCFEKALSLAPDLIEAHFSKGITLVLYLKDPAKAVTCFETAYRLEPQMDRRWRHGRYWFSRALLLSGQAEAALAQAEHGLRLCPDDIPLLNQKAIILRYLWPRLPKYSGPALDFFTFRARCFRSDYETLGEVIKLCLYRGTPDAAWDSLDFSLARHRHAPRRLAEIAGLTVTNFLAGFEAARAYRQFREQYSAGDHFAAFKTAGLLPNREMARSLDDMLIAPFGVAYRHIEARALTKDISDIPVIYDELLEKTTDVFSAFGADWLAPYTPSEKADQNRLMELGMAALPEAAILEAGRIIGFVAGKFDLPPIKQKLRRESWSLFKKDAGVRLAMRAAEDWGLLDDDC